MTDMFGGLPRRVTIDTQIRAAERELTMRKNNYPRWGNDKRISADFARDQIEAMEAIVETLKQCKERGEIATRISGA